MSAAPEWTRVRSAADCAGLARELRAASSWMTCRGLRERAADLAELAAGLDARAQAWAQADDRLTRAARAGFLTDDPTERRSLRDEARAAAADLRAAQSGGAGPWVQAMERERERWREAVATAGAAPLRRELSRGTAAGPPSTWAEFGDVYAPASEPGCEGGASGEGSPSRRLRVVVG